MVPKISVCIPAYNKPETLGFLLESVALQDYKDFEIVVSEDHSPRFQDIESVVKTFIDRYPTIRTKLFLNQENLGYDANMRSMFTKASGQFCVFMGDDDLLLPGALRKLGSVIDKYPNLGVILRSWKIVDWKTGEDISLFRYFPSDRFFEAGLATIATFFRRSVALCGYTVCRLDALKIPTEEFDGTLLYQLYLTLNILSKKDGYYVSEIFFAMRKPKKQNEIVHYFGSSKKEEGFFKPGVFGPVYSLNFMKGMIRIALYSKKLPGLNGEKLSQALIRDIDTYSYPFMAMHRARLGVIGFTKYVFDLARIGFGKTFFFWIYFLMLILFGEKLSDALVNRIKWFLGGTPLLGKFYIGKCV